MQNAAECFHFEIISINYTLAFNSRKMVTGCVYESQNSKRSVWQGILFIYLFIFLGGKGEVLVYFGISDNQCGQLSIH